MEAFLRIVFASHTLVGKLILLRTLADDERAKRSERARHSEWGHKSGLNKLIASGDGAGRNTRRSDSTELNSI